MESYDAAIIGAGPAGSAAAIELAKGGVEYCLIDRSEFPRDKLCAGLLTVKAVRALEDLGFAQRDFDLLRSTRVNIYNKYELNNSFDVEKPMFLSNRIDFDAVLFARAASGASRVMTGKAVVSIDAERREVTLADGERIRCGALILADGASGMGARVLGRSPNVFCMEANLPVRKDDDAIDLFFNVVSWGYGWVFPKNNGVTIGFGELYNRRSDYIRKFVDFAARLGYRLEREDLRGRFTPFGAKYDDDLLRFESVYPVGDVIGLTDSITGEGIYFALASGRKIAALLVKHGLNSDDVEREYEEYLRGIFRIMDSGAKVCKIIYGHAFATSAALTVIKNRNSLMRFYCDNVVSEYNFMPDDLTAIKSAYDATKNPSPLPLEE